MHDVDSRFLDTIENQIFTDWEASVAGPQFIARTARLWNVSKQPEVMHQKVYETVGGGFIVACDALPYLKHVAPRSSR